MMSATPLRIPVWTAAVGSYGWAWTVLRKHWRVVAVTAMACVAIEFFLGFRPLEDAPPSSLDMFASFLGSLGLWIAIIPMALVTHNEVLRGRAPLSQVVLGRGGGRIVLFWLDQALIGLGVLALLFIPIGLTFVPLVLSAPVRPTWLYPLPTIGSAVFVLLGFFLSMRLMLRLPSRAIARTMTWLQTWRFGKGNTWRLALTSILIFLPIIPIVIVQILLPMGTLAHSIVQSALSVANVLLFASFLSLAYLNLIRHAAPPRLPTIHPA